MAIVELGSFRVAAEELYLDQSVVSRRLQRLEAELGTLLVARSAPVGTTEAGRGLYERIAPHVRELAAVLRETRVASAQEFHVGYIAPAIVTLVPAVLETLRARTPAPTVELHELPSVKVRSGLQAGRLSLGFLLEEFADSTLEFLPLATFRYGLALPASDQLARRGTVRAAELADRTLLTLARHEPIHARIIKQLQRFAPDLRWQDAFGFAEIQHLVASGLGFAAVPVGVMAEPPAGIVVVDVDPPLPTGTIGMAAPRPLVGELVQACFGEMRARRATSSEKPLSARAAQVKDDLAARGAVGQPREP